VSRDGDVSSETTRSARERLSRDAERSGYHLNPDAAKTERIVRGLLVNEGRFGYRSCPCRLAAGERGRDRDIICPCDYRDADLTEWGSCFCGLYVSAAVLKGERALAAVPERRPPGGAAAKRPAAAGGIAQGRALPVWRCRVCGYLCARDGPPEVCPICKAAADRFERYV